MTYAAMKISITGRTNAKSMFVSSNILMSRGHERKRLYSFMSLFMHTPVSTLRELRISLIENVAAQITLSDAP